MALLGCARVWQVCCCSRVVFGLRVSSLPQGLGLVVIEMALPVCTHLPLRSVEGTHAGEPFRVGRRSRKARVAPMPSSLCCDCAGVSLQGAFSAQVPTRERARTGLQALYLVMGYH